MLRRLVLSAALAGLAITSAQAWDPIGHMLVGQIAYDQLTPGAKTAVDAAIARFNEKDPAHDAPYGPVTIACWMDDIRSQPEMKPFAVWHYVNLPFTPEGLPFPDDDAGPNVVWGLEKAESILTGKATDPGIDKDMALVILIHLVGDIHQPLHTTSRAEDAGGNKVKIGNLKDPLADLIFTKGGNLHFFWDSAYRRVYRDGKATVLYEAPLHDRHKPVAGHQAFTKEIRAEAAKLEKKYPPSQFKELGNARSWATESHGLGYEQGYQKLPAANGSKPINLPAGYVEDARKCAEQRIVLAGYRLGHLLNTIFAPAEATPAPDAAAPKPPAEIPPVQPTPAPGG